MAHCLSDQTRLVCACDVTPVSSELREKNLQAVAKEGEINLSIVVIECLVLTVKLLICRQHLAEMMMSQVDLFTRE